MAAFPTYARILLAGFGEQAESGVTRTPMESGPPKQLQVKSRVLVTRRVQIHLASRADYLTFKTFFETTLHMGADWFTWDDPVSGTSTNARLVDGIGTARPLRDLAGPWVIDAALETWSA